MIDNTHSGMNSCVLFRNNMSRCFPLEHGVRQGGVLSALFYLVCINDLLHDIDWSKSGAMLLDICVSTSVQADDIALISSNEHEMQNLIDLCEHYSSSWAFNFSPSKSQVLHYGVNPRNVSNKLTLYGDTIPLVTSSKHVGILLESSLKSTNKTFNACRSLRSSVLSVINSGIHPSIVNPLTCSKIVQQLCYTKALYGCELWSSLTQSETEMLERSHKFACKTLQGLPKRTRSDKCTSLLGWFSIECYIDKCKLLFFGRICRLKSNALPRRIMVTRLFEFKYRCTKTQLGFIPDVYRLAHKYDMTEHLVTFMDSGKFPSKKAWSAIVRDQIKRFEAIKRREF